MVVIDENGITIKIDDIVVLIGPNNVRKTTSIRAYEMFANSGTILKIDDFYQNNENNPVEIAGVFGEITNEDKQQIGEKWIYKNNDKQDVIKYKWRWEKSGVKGEKYSWYDQGSGGWDSKIASCIPVPLKISPFDDSIQFEKIYLTSAVKENVKNDQSKATKLLDQVNDLANEVKKQIAEELQADLQKT